MDDDAVFAASAAERRSIADVLAGLTAEQRTAPSWCEGWDVATVGAHLAAAITTSLPAFTTALLRSRGSFDRANDRLAKRAAAAPLDVSIAVLREHAESRFSPPGTGPRAPLTDVLVHSGDICRPLGLPHDPPADRVRTALDFLTGPRSIGFVRRGSLAGIGLHAEDLEAGYGADPGGEQEIRGRGIDIVMAVCGRKAALSLVTGPGVETLQRRLSR